MAGSGIVRMAVLLGALSLVAASSLEKQPTHDRPGPTPEETAPAIPAGPNAEVRAFYVDPARDDANARTLESLPVRTLGRALKLVLPLGLPRG